MNFFSNQELAETYHVSVRTVRNWIDSARSGKVDLVLQTKGAHDYIAITAKNISAIENLVAEGKKFRPHRAYKTLSPKPEFYELFTHEQIHDIVSNIEIYHEIPPDYNYLGEGAESVDAYLHRLLLEPGLNGLNATEKLLRINAPYIDDVLKKYDKVNIIDVGAGNALPVRGFLAHMLELGKLNRYIALDISATMLAIAKENIEKWFGNRAQFEGHIYDFNFQRFSGWLAQEYLKKDANKTANVILFFGGTLSNLRSPDAALRSIHESMGVNDILIYREKLDSAINRKLFDVDAEPGSPTIITIYSYVVNLLNIDKSLYDVELGYDEVRHERYERIRFKMAITLRFKFENGERSVVLNKDDTLLVWRSRQQDAFDVLRQFDKNGFYALHTSQTENQEYILTVSRLKRA